MHVLLVEDDDSIADPLERGLRREGFEVTRVSTGAAALAADRHELVLLDLGLPDMDGYDVCRAMRSQGDTPIIVISARGEEVDRVIGLELGADDYLVKPFGFRELVARIRAVTRRLDRSPAGPRRTDTVTFDGVELDSRTRRVRVDGQDVALTRKEFDLLALLARDPGATCTRQEILDEVWDPHWYGPTKTLDVHVATLRRKLGRPGLIETIRGVGFRLDVEPEPEPEPMGERR